MTSQRKPHAKKADRLTTEEAMQRLFPKRVRETVKKVAEESKSKSEVISDKDAT